MKSRSITFLYTLVVLLSSVSYGDIDICAGRCSNRQGSLDAMAQGLPGKMK